METFGEHLAPIPEDLLPFVVWTVPMRPRTSPSITSMTRRTIGGCWYWIAVPFVVALVTILENTDLRMVATLGPSPPPRVAHDRVTSCMRRMSRRRASLRGAIGSAQESIVGTTPTAAFATGGAKRMSRRSRWKSLPRSPSATNRRPPGAVPVRVMSQRPVPQGQKVRRPPLPLSRPLFLGGLLEAWDVGSTG